MQKSNIDILKAAYKNETIEVTFLFIPSTTPKSGDELIGVLGVADAQDIFRERERLRDVKLIEYREQYGDEPINEKKWKEQFKLVRPEHKENIEKGKPESLAEQFADEDVNNILIRELLPKYFKTPEGESLFPSPEEQQKFGSLALSTPSLNKVVMDGVNELTTRIAKMGEQAKNS